MLLKSDKPYTTDSVIEELERMGIYIDDDVNATIEAICIQGIYSTSINI